MEMGKLLNFYETQFHHPQNADLPLPLKVVTLYMCVCFCVHMYM